MKTISKIKYVLFFLVIVGFVSCKGEIGPIGPDGTDGTNGIDGTDGNANVQTFVFNNPIWSTTNSYLQLIIPDLGTNIANGDAILGYVDIDAEGGNIYAVPGAVITNNGTKNYNINYYPSSDKYYIVSFDPDGARTITADLPGIAWVKVIIIESTNTTIIEGNGKSVSPQQTVFDELEAAEVDVNDYFAVCDYYGINP